MTYVRITDSASPVHNRIGLVTPHGISVDYQLYPASDFAPVDLDNGLNLLSSLETMAELGRRALVGDDSEPVQMRLL